MKIFRYAIISILMCLFLVIGCKSESLKIKQQPLNRNDTSESPKVNTVSDPKKNQQQPPDKKNLTEPPKGNTVNDPKKNQQQPSDKKNLTEPPKGNTVNDPKKNQQQPSDKKNLTEPPKSNTAIDPKSSQNPRSESSVTNTNSLPDKNRSQVLSNPKQWKEIIGLPSNHTNTDIIVDFPYASTANFVKTKLYSCSRCFLRPDVAIAVTNAHNRLKKKGYRLKLFDCYRPRKVQYKMWKIKPDPRYVGNPDKGSDHNRGLAVDLTIIDSNGKELDMGTPFDDFSLQAHHTYRQLSAKVIKNRLLLKDTMRTAGFRHINTEWWHYAWNGKKSDIAEDEWNCPKSDRSNPKRIPGT